MEIFERFFNFEKFLFHLKACFVVLNVVLNCALFLSSNDPKL